MITRFALWLSRRGRAALVAAAGWASVLLADGVLTGRAREVAIVIVAVATILGVHASPSRPPRE